MKICTVCNKLMYFAEGWSLNNYYGLSGLFCRDCFELIEHDAYGVPENKNEYLRILLLKGTKPK